MNRLLHHYDLTEAKFYAILNHFFGYSVRESMKILSDYTDYKIYSNDLTEILSKNHVKDCLSISTRQVISRYSVFYSFCYGYYKFIAVALALAGYKIAVLVSPQVYASQLIFFSIGKETFEEKYGRLLDVDIVPITQANLFIHLRKKISQGYKIIIFVDGNMGIHENGKLLREYDFFNTRVSFHSGYAYLNKLCGYNSVCGLLCQINHNTIEVITLEKCISEVDGMNKGYIDTVNMIILDQLSQLIKMGICQWDSLPSVYTWSRCLKRTTPSYFPFILEGDYCVINIADFMIYRIPWYEYLYRRVWYGNGR